MLDTARAVAGARRARRPGGDGDGLQLHEAVRRTTATSLPRPTCAIPWSSALAGGTFVPNDIELERRRTHQLVILTGPNMGGKSTYLRQVALLCAAGADRVVRAGPRGQDRRWSIASSRASARRTTSPAASRPSWSRCRRPRTSCSGATSRSLVVLDEVGRGTATFDGLSIAWAVAEHLATNPRARPKTLFATHYHELTDLADALPACRQRPRRGAGVEGRHRLPAQDPARPLGSQLRHPGGAAGRPAAVGGDAGAATSCERSNRTSSSRGGRPSLSGAAAAAPAAAGPLPGRHRPRMSCANGSATSTSNRTTPLDALRIIEELKKSRTSESMIFVLLFFC